MIPRVWKKTSPAEWRCAPWMVSLRFIDGCSLFVLSRLDDPAEGALAHCEDLDGCMLAARALEGAA